ncbi:DUF4232 domain-containing protein [Mycobacterium sp. EPa45]|uniref:DUF4232 domain-containing protein n=1 Tax=Mycobacterium sp. EPa45 TaxID=1545728 RepID=UPI0009E32358|nr:DUF4232 domain-containing protein [Mycobacterium sp. EPa45]
MTLARPATLLLTVVLLAGCSAQGNPAQPPPTAVSATTSAAAAATPPPVATATVTVTATPVPGPQSTPTASAGCAGDGLAVTAGPLESAQTQRHVTVSFTNTSAHPCTLVGFPGADLVTPAGGVLINVPRRPANAAHHLTLNPGDTATADVSASTIDSATGQTCARWGALVVTAPNDDVPHAMSVDVPICDATVSAVD